MGDGPPRFRRNFTCSAVLRIHSRENEVSTTGLLPSTTDLSRSLRLPRSFVTPYRMSYNPKRQASWFGLCSVSLAATQEIAFAFSSSRYLDVSVPWVCLPYPMYSDKDTIPLRMGFPHSEIFGSKLTYSSPKHIGVSPVLHRLLVSRHPPCALSNLTKLKIKKYELHCYLVFKEHTFIYER
ncbi:hypothetical protein DF16_orf00001 [Bacillus thuringiensis serovar kurstaki str. YBT-1520]|nr:hypothetical protein DF16_orf00001 [Bacillus thuringiensis serovar kurstaki str. YBT-1520]